MNKFPLGGQLIVKRLKSLNYKLIFTIMLLISNIFMNAKVFALSSSTRQIPVQEIEGSDKIETAISISKYHWKNTSEYVVVASVDDFFGALCAVPLASKLNCPILFTEKNTLNKNTKEEITRLGAKKVYIIGDSNIISQDTENEVKKIASRVDRVSGKDKTSISDNILSIIGKSDEIFIVNENDFPDSLSIASIAGEKRAPIIFTNKNDLSATAVNYIKNNNIKESCIIGGQGIVSDNILNKVPNPCRLFGENRYETNTEIIKHFSNELKMDNTFIVPGENISTSIQGIPAAVVAQSSLSPLILMGTSIDTYTESFIESNYSNIGNAIIIGGESTISSEDLKIFSDVSSTNAKDYLDTVSYDGSNQGCHPKVLYFPNKWNGWRYWMVFTPYPNSDDQYENPSILVSQTDHKWVIPNGLVNPVASGLNKKGCHLSDPHLVFNENTDQLELWYRATYFDTDDEIIRITSKDGVHWSKPQNMISFYDQKECLSPAVIFENNKYKMWYVDQNLKCMYTECGTDGHWSMPKEVNLNLKDSYVPWHLDVIKTDLGYEILFSAFKLNEAKLNNRVLMWGTSSDGLNFNNVTTVLIPTNHADSWDDKQIYRSTFIKDNGIYKVFYSAMNKNNQWHIGLAEGKSMKDLHGCKHRKHKGNI